MEPPPTPANSVWVLLYHLSVGAASGAINKTAVAPIERVKLLLQTQHSSTQIPPTKRYKGMLDAFRRIPSEQGIQSFWRGVVAEIARFFPTQAVNFYFADLNSVIIVHRRDSHPILNFIETLLSGFIAGAVSLLLVYPLDFARTRLAADVGRDPKSRQFTSTWDCIKKISRSDGLGALYSGYLAGVGGILVYRAAFMGAYIRVQHHFANMKKKPTRLQIYLVPQSVTVFAGLLSTPFDLVRRRLMMQPGRKANGLNVQYTGTLDCFRKIIREEGPAALFTGALAGTIRGLVGTLVFMLYEEVLNAILYFSQESSSSSSDPPP